MTATAEPYSADALVERLFGATLGALELMSVYLGWRLELYDRLSEEGPLTVGELADSAGIDERYAREWLEQQAAAGLLQLANEPGGSDATQRYSLPEAHRDVLVDPQSLSHIAPFAAMIVGIGKVLPEVAEAYRTGAGVPYESYGRDFRDGQGAINRPAYHHLIGQWVDAMPDVAQRLRQAGSRAIDLGCGQGWSTIALAKEFPNAEVIGLDSDAASIADAEERAAAAGAPVAFRIADASEPGGSADLVCIFEALHDMAKPVSVLRAARDHLAPGGAVLLVDERVSDALESPASEVDRMMYGWSVLHCLPASRVEAGSAALGTVLRRDVVRSLAGEAGFDVTELAIDNDFFRFYRLDAGT